MSEAHKAHHAPRAGNKKDKKDKGKGKQTGGYNEKVRFQYPSYPPHSMITVEFGGAALSCYYAVDS